MQTRSLKKRRRGAAFLLALFVMSACSMIVIATLDTQVLQFSALRNTMEYDRARYLAEAAVQHSLAFLEQDYAIDDDLNVYDLDWQNFPDANNQYRVDLSEGANGTVIILADGRSGQVTRHLEITVKMGG